MSYKKLQITRKDVQYNIRIYFPCLLCDRFYKMKVKKSDKLVFFDMYRLIIFIQNVKTDRLMR